ncbi:MAG: hypothetical protein WBH83_14190 [Methanosarcina flavescens]
MRKSLITSLFKKGLSENSELLDLITLSPNPIWRDKHKLFKKNFDHKPFQKRLEQNRCAGLSRHHAGF